MSRETIPKKIREVLLDEYDHRCAVCGGDRPHIHHIDEDATNNEVLNLLPLCPNCHLRDQHNPTRKVDIGKLKLFRLYKDPAILKPQFHPIYLRQVFLESIEPTLDPVREIEAKVNELVEFVHSFEMGEFYSKRLSELMAPIRRPGIIPLDDAHEAKLEKRRQEDYKEYREKLLTNKDSVQSLLIEMLRYQNWANA